MASYLASGAGSSAGTVAGLASSAAKASAASSSSSSAAWASPLLSNLQEVINSASSAFNKLPGSAIILRYIASSYQDDPIRSLLELFLVVFAVRTVLQSRTRGGSSGSNFVKLSQKEINELVSEFHPEPLCAPLTEKEVSELNSVPTVIGGASCKPKVSLPSHQNGKPITCTNLASYNFTNLADDERVKERAIATLRSYGVGSCSPPGFYGTIDVHMALEADLARFIGSQSAIIYSQAFSTISSVIPAFSKRGDIIIADRGVSFAIQKGIQISRSTVRWYDHNNLQSLEDALESVRRDDKRRRGPLTRRFIVTEGIFEGDGAKTDLARVVELKKRYKFRLILDESISFGTVGATGRGMTELCNVPAKEVEILVGSMANTLGAAGGFCAGSDEVVFHQRINGTAFVFSAALPAMLAVASSTAIGNLISNPSILSTLQENVKILRTTLDSIESLYIPSDQTSPLIHIQIRSKLEKHPETPQDKFERSLNGNGGNNSSLTVPTNNNNNSLASSMGDGNHDLSPEEQKLLLQKILDDALSNGVLLVLHKKLPSINPPLLDVGAHARPSIRIAVSSAFSKKEMEKASNVVKNSVIKVLGKRR